MIPSPTSRSKITGIITFLVYSEVVNEFAAPGLELGQKCGELVR